MNPESTQERQAALTAGRGRALRSLCASVPPHAAASALLFVSCGLLVSVCRCDGGGEILQVRLQRSGRSHMLKICRQHSRSSSSLSIISELRRFAMNLAHIKLLQLLRKQLYIFFSTYKPQTFLHLFSSNDQHHSPVSDLHPLLLLLALHLIKC